MLCFRLSVSNTFTLTCALIGQNRIDLLFVTSIDKLYFQLISKLYWRKTSSLTGFRFIKTVAASIVSEHLVKDRPISSDINGQNVEVFFRICNPTFCETQLKFYLAHYEQSQYRKFLNYMFLRKVLFCLSVDGIPMYRMLFN